MNWVDILKEMKQAQINDLLATGMILKNDKVWITVTVPNKICNEKNQPRDLLLKALAALRLASDPDLIVFISDAYFKQMPKDTDTPINLKKEFEKGNKDVTESLICMTINKAKELNLIAVPYSYGGGNIIIWGDIKYDSLEELSGYIPRILTDIMNRPLISELPEAIAVIKLFKINAERQIYHGTKGCITFLKSKGYTIVDTMPEPNDDFEDKVFGEREDI